MARTFTPSTTDAASNATASPGVVSAAAFTIGGWLYPTGVGVVTGVGSFGGSPLLSDTINEADDIEGGIDTPNDNVVTAESLDFF